MTGLDTNVLVRYITQDDPEQVRFANAAMEGLTVDAPGFVSAIVLVELFWTLKRAYGLSRDAQLEVIGRLLGARELVIEHRDEVREAVQLARIHNVRFADALIGLIHVAQGCQQTATFDQNAARMPQFRRLDG